jgi:hypothetical protein
VLVVPVAVLERDGALEDVGVLLVVRPGGIGARDAELVAQLGEEELVVGALRGAGGLPALQEVGE